MISPLSHACFARFPIIEIVPELPEVETTRRALAGALTGRRIVDLRVYQPRLRYPVPSKLPQLLRGQRIQQFRRRAKYLIMDFHHGKLLIHLGMSGSLRLIEQTRKKAASPRQPHVHLELSFADSLVRYHDPRRFGFWVWEDQDQADSRLDNLGLEPLERAFSAQALAKMARDKKTSIKSLLMDGRHLVGVGNIYANEALWLSNILPFRAASDLTQEEIRKLVNAIKKVLKQALQAGGTSLRNYVTAEGNPGYFALKLKVYGKHTKPCPRCGTKIERRVMTQRSTFYCPNCQQ